MANSATKPAKSPAKKVNQTFTAEERAAMKDAAREAKRGKDFDGEAECLAAIEKMTGLDRQLAERIHAIVKEVAPDLAPRTWYGMPAYSKNGNVLCFFQSADKFKARYATFGFNGEAALDEGNMWPVYYAIKTLTHAEEKKIAELIKQAVGQ